MGFDQFAELPVTDQQLVLALAPTSQALSTRLDYLRHEARAQNSWGIERTKPRALPLVEPHNPLERKSSMKTISALIVLLLSSVCWPRVKGLSRIGTRLEE